MARTERRLLAGERTTIQRLGLVVLATRLEQTSEVVHGGERARMARTERRLLAG